FVHPLVALERDGKALRLDRPIPRYPLFGRGAGFRVWDRNQCENIPGAPVGLFGCVRRGWNLVRSKSSSTLSLYSGPASSSRLRFLTRLDVAYFEHDSRLFGSWVVWGLGRTFPAHTFLFVAIARGNTVWKCLPTPSAASVDECCCRIFSRSERGSF